MPKKIEDPNQPPRYVITCGDEGVQMNEGNRLSFVGAGYKLEGFSEAVKILKKLLGSDLRITSSHENDWMKKQLDLSEWDEVDAMTEQHVQALADQEGLNYAGNLPFKDPKKLKFDIKGHMVRPKNVHVANKICFTLGGGEQTYNLSCYQISADWVHKAKPKTVKSMMETQIKFYKEVAGKKLEYMFEEEGPLGEKVAAKNRKILEKIGIKETYIKPAAK